MIGYNATTAEECEVLDGPANRWFPHIYWLHDLPAHIDVLIAEANRRLAEFVDQFDGKRVLCRKCLKDALIVDRRVDSFDDE